MHSGLWGRTPQQHSTMARPRGRSELHVSAARRPLWLEAMRERRRGRVEEERSRLYRVLWLPCKSSGFYSAREEEPPEGSLQERRALIYLRQGSDVLRETLQ